MTISTTITKAGPFSGNDVTVSFPYAFKIFSDSDLKVTHVDALDVETVLTLGIDYTVTGAGDSGGNILYPVSGDPLATGETLIAVSDIDVKQLTDLSNQGGFFPEVHETAFDKLCRMIQQQLNKVGAGLSLSDASSYSDLTLPDPAAGYMLQWKNDLSGLQNVSGMDASLYTVSSYMETLLDDADATEARGTLGAVGLDDSNIFTKIQGWSKGSDVASSATLTLGDDGNYFDITGTTDISSIVSVGAGTVIKLHFDNQLKITHHATDLVLPGSCDIYTFSGLELEFTEYINGDWRLTGANQPFSVPEYTVNSNFPVGYSTTSTSYVNVIDYYYIPVNGKAKISVWLKVVAGGVANARVHITDGGGGSDWYSSTTHISSVGNYLLTTEDVTLFRDFFITLQIKTDNASYAATGALSVGDGNGNFFPLWSPSITPS